MNVLCGNDYDDCLIAERSRICLVQDIVNEGKEPKNEQKNAVTFDYCKQDTFVMVEIFRILNETIAKICP